MAEPAAGLSLERAGTTPLSSALPSQTRVPLSAMAKIEKHRGWPILAKLPMRCAVSAVVPHFRVRNLLAMKPGDTLESVWPTTEDVPLTVGGVLVFWSEFELVEERLAVRLTRLP
jgi:flagellar motor switch protein FliN/FliY